MICDTLSKALIHYPPLLSLGGMGRSRSQCHILSRAFGHLDTRVARFNLYHQVQPNTLTLLSGSFWTEWYLSAVRMGYTFSAKALSICSPIWSFFIFQNWGLYMYHYINGLIYLAEDMPLSWVFMRLIWVEFVQRREAVTRSVIKARFVTRWSSSESSVWSMMKK